MQPRRPQVQRAPSSSTTTWPISPAPPRPRPGSAVEDQSAADAGAPEDAEQRVVGPPGAEAELGVGRDLHVVAERHPTAERRFELRRRAGRCLPSPGRLRALVTLPASITPGEPTPTPASSAGSTPAALRRIAQRLLHLRRDIRQAAARSASGAVRSRSRLWSSSTITAWILVPPRSMPPKLAAMRAHHRRRPHGATGAPSSGLLGVRDRRGAGLRGDLRRGQRADAREQLVPLRRAEHRRGHDRRGRRAARLGRVRGRPDGGGTQRGARTRGQELEADMVRGSGDRLRVRRRRGSASG